MYILPFADFAQLFMELNTWNYFQCFAHFGNTHYIALYYKNYCTPENSRMYENKYFQQSILVVKTEYLNTFLIVH